ncbi:hypothetical protein [Yersinia enterocolitica]|uniref:hypothetical protein n=1 Tax=Yersinia enterocolitica TaxID=630 RepID=UPI002AC61E11|nr:hypothetical protein [Yersinia enterocolitica]HDL6653424.1 hypothetical protein [Yersinia enterocolitica]HEN3551560.1 hypothetical protein [Yersinia enterocolitica]
MKSNREAKRLLGMFNNDTLRISNRGWLVFSVNYPNRWVHRKPSASQNRAKKRDVEVEYAECVCGELGEVNFDGYKYYCGGSPRCCP